MPSHFQKGIHPRYPASFRFPLLLRTLASGELQELRTPSSESCCLLRISNTFRRGLKRLPLGTLLHVNVKTGRCHTGNMVCLSPFSCFVVDGNTLWGIRRTRHGGSRKHAANSSGNMLLGLLKQVVEIPESRVGFQIRCGGILNMLMGPQETPTRQGVTVRGLEGTRSESGRHRSESGGLRSVFCCGVKAW